MATRSPLLRIHDMLESIRGIEKALAGKTIRDYERSWLLRSAVERDIKIIPLPPTRLQADTKMPGGNYRPPRSTSHGSMKFGDTNRPRRAAGPITAGFSAR
jgi:hypothetical protein